MLESRSELSPEVNQILDETLAALDRIEANLSHYRATFCNAIQGVSPEDVTPEYLEKLWEDLGDPRGSRELPLSQLDRKRFPELHSILNFFRHDLGHLGQKFGINHLYYLTELSQESTVSCLPLKRVQAAAFEWLQSIPISTSLLDYPCELARQLIKLERGQGLDLEDVQLRPLLHSVSYAVAGISTQKDLYVGSPVSRETRRNEIIVDCQDVELHTSAVFLTSILFNLVNNAVKAISSKEEDSSPLEERLLKEKYPEYPARIYLLGRTLPEHNLAVIQVADSGGGFKIDQIIESLKALWKDGLIDAKSLGNLGPIWTNWASGVHSSIRQATTGQFIDAAFIPRITGYDRKGYNTALSGTGLHSAEVFVEHLYGWIQASNTFNSEALITLVLPLGSASDSKMAFSTGLQAFRKDFYSVPMPALF